MTVAVVLIALALVALIALRASVMTHAPGGRILAFVGLLVVPVLALVMGLADHVERSKRVEFCTSCHLMEDYGRSLYVDDVRHLPATHFQNGRVPRDTACFTCHTDYAMYGDLRAKLRGLRHVYVQYLGTVPSRPHLYRPYNNRECLHCHGGARSYLESVTHKVEPGRLAAIASNRMSCLTKGCHDVVHDIDGLKSASFWTQPGVGSAGDASR